MALSCSVDIEGDGSPFDGIDKESDEIFSVYLELHSHVVEHDVRRARIGADIGNIDLSFKRHEHKRVVGISELYSYRVFAQLVHHESHAQRDTHEGMSERQLLCVDCVEHSHYRQFSHIVLSEVTSYEGFDIHFSLFKGAAGKDRLCAVQLIILSHFQFFR